MSGSTTSFTWQQKKKHMSVKQQSPDEITQACMIFDYLRRQSTAPEMLDIYTKARSATYKYNWQEDYFFTDEDRNYLLMLAAGWSATLRKAYRIFVKDMGFNRHCFWDAFIKWNVFCQNILFDPQWEGIFKADDEWTRLIKKTHNPTLIEKMFRGDITNRWLYQELEKT